MALLFVGLGAVAVYACLRPKVISVKADRLLVRRGEKVIAQVPFANVEAITILWAYPNRTPPAGGLVGLAAGAVAAANAKQKPSGVRIRLKDVGDADTFCPARWLKRKTREVMMAWHMEDSYEEVVKEMRAREKAYLKANGLWPPPAAEGGKNPFDFS
ncbi:MAG TPA: hypothetical protein VFW33_23710 [Gemmataceae bacterium]|nr:hypothetical protein [Gemmataceae bacterium]